MSRDELQDALDDYAIALEKAPNDPAFIAARGYTHRRAGNWDQAVEDFERARQLDPRNATLFRDLGGHTYVITHQYQKATEAYGWALELTPGWVDVAWRRARAFCNLQGNLDSLRALVADSPNLEWWDVWDFKMLEGRAEDALSDLPTVLTDVYANQMTVGTDFMYEGWTHWVLGDEGAAHAAFDSARVLLEEWEREHPGDPRVHGGLGYVYAGLGRPVDAARRANLHLEAHRHDALNWDNAVSHALRIYAAAGLADEVFSLVERQTEGLGQPHYCGLKYGFHFNPIRSDPRFEALLERLAPVGEP